MPGYILAKTFFCYKIYPYSVIDGVSAIDVTIFFNSGQVAKGWGKVYKEKFSKIFNDGWCSIEVVHSFEPWYSHKTRLIKVLDKVI